MARHVLLVFTNPLPGQDDEYNRWYDGQHVPDVLRIPGFVGARRFRVESEAANAGGLPPTKYLAIYEVESDDIEATLKDLRSRVGTPAMVTSATVDRANTVSWAMAAFGPHGG